MKKKIGLVSMSLVLMFSMTSTVAAQSNKSELKKADLYEKLGFTQEYVSGLDANPNGLARGVEIKNTNNKDIRKAIEFGFTEQEIADFTETDWNYLVGKNADLVSVEEKYIAITKDGQAQEVNKEIALEAIEELEHQQSMKSSGGVSLLATEIGSDPAETSWMKVLTTVTKDTFQTPTAYYLKHSFEWKSEPFWTLEDAIGITHSSHLSQIQNSEIFKYTFDYHTNDLLQTYVGTHSNYKWTADNKGPTGYAFKYDILSRHTSGVIEHIVKKSRGHMIFGVTNSNPNFIEGDAYGHYTHSEIAILVSIGVKVNVNSISVSGATKTTKMTDTHAGFDL